MKPKIVDVIGKVLDEHRVIAGERPAYRIFAKQLLKLYFKGHTVFKIRFESKETPKVWINRFNLLKNKYGIKFRKSSFEELGVYVFWTMIRDEKSLIKCYSHLVGLSEETLKDIVERLKSYEEIIYII